MRVSRQPATAGRDGRKVQIIVALPRHLQQLIGGHNIGAFGYVIDVDSQHSYPAAKTSNNSSQSRGLQYVGKVSVPAVRAAYASQADAGDGTGFATPLATLHKFQRWADKLLNTPDDGVEDLFSLWLPARVLLLLGASLWP
jgi:hypothetical protein